MTPRSRKYFQRKKIKYGPSILEPFVQYMHRILELAEMMEKRMRPVRRPDRIYPEMPAMVSECGAEVVRRIGTFDVKIDNAFTPWASATIKPVNVETASSAT